MLVEDSDSTRTVAVVYTARDDVTGLFFTDLSRYNLQSQAQELRNTVNQAWNFAFGTVEYCTNRVLYSDMDTVLYCTVVVSYSYVLQYTPLQYPILIL